MEFSERTGIISKNTQIKEVNLDTRIKLWNLITDIYLNMDLFSFVIYRELYTIFLKRTTDTFPIRYHSEIMPEIHKIKEKSEEEIRKEMESFGEYLAPIRKKLIKIHFDLKKYFMECEWFKVFDFLEFIIKYYIKKADSTIHKKALLIFVEGCNKILEDEKSAYRCIEFRFVPITDDVEIREVDLALRHPNKAVNEHLNQALKKLSTSDTNYRIAADEAIKAVESLFKSITPKTTTLGKAINEFRKKKKKLQINDQFLNAIEKLYAWANATTRHGSETEVPSVGINEAKFVFVICAGIINYLSSIKMQ